MSYVARCKIEVLQERLKELEKGAYAQRACKGVLDAALLVGLLLNINF